MRKIRFVTCAVAVLAMAALAGCSISQKSAAELNCDNQAKGKRGSTTLDCEKGR